VIVGFGGVAATDGELPNIVGPTTVPTTTPAQRLAKATTVLHFMSLLQSFAAYLLSPTPDPCPQHSSPQRRRETAA
jgi:hypothetical protein